MLTCDVCGLKCEDSLHFKLHTRQCNAKPQKCELCSKLCNNAAHRRIHLRNCLDSINKLNDRIEKFTEKGQCPYCKMYGHQTPFAPTCCRRYKYYEDVSIVDQMNEYYARH
jgi:hypothetical protein